MEQVIDPKDKHHYDPKRLLLVAILKIRLNEIPRI
jgi:hypothetical protein